MDWLALPKTPFLLDTVRPDLTMLRVISRGLIAWSDVAPTEEYVKAQVPKYVPECIYEALGTLRVVRSRRSDGEGKENIDQQGGGAGAAGEESMDEGSESGEDLGDAGGDVDIQLLS
jgi:hypothetical protein